MNETKQYRDGDKMIEVTVKTHGAVIDWQEIVDACQVEQDDLYETPWENCDGFGHRADGLNRLNVDRDDAENARGWAWSDGRRERVLITLETENCDRYTFDHLRQNGAARQVAAEMVAMHRRRTLDTIVDWYENGWEWWMTTCDIHDAMASCGGIDSYDYANGEMRQEIAWEIAGQLEDAGYTVTNHPPKYSGPSTEARRQSYRRQLLEQSWTE